MSRIARRLGFGSLGTALSGFAGWLTWLNLQRPIDAGWIFWVPLVSCTATMGLLCWWAAIAGHRPATQARIGASWRTGWVVGAISFAAGFVGPLLLNPSANLGPLLGILITGPFGFVLGALGAAALKSRP